jgi:hypothetical protein
MRRDDSIHEHKVDLNIGRVIYGYSIIRSERHDLSLYVFEFFGPASDTRRSERLLLHRPELV